MAHQPKHEEHKEVDFSESSVYGKDDNESRASLQGDTATSDDLDRLESITGGADEPSAYEGELGRKFDELDATTDEEIDALQLDLTQDDNLPNTKDGSGRIVDDVAEERLAEFTEVGRDLDLEGALSVVPGREDTSAVLNKHQARTAASAPDPITEDDYDEPRDETLTKHKGD